MLDYLLAAWSLTIAAAIAIVTTRMLLQPPHRRLGQQVDLPSGIPVSEIGKIERDLPYLQMVIVIADTVEKPAASLSEAVEHNFGRHVKYLFLVSPETVSQEIEGYYTLFETLAKIVIRRKLGPSKQLKDLVDIQQLPYNWDDYPHIFYRLELPSGEKKTLAFRGDKLNKGIAAHYARVDPAYAHTIWRAVTSDAPKSVAVSHINMDRDQFHIDPKLQLPHVPAVSDRVQ